MVMIIPRRIGLKVIKQLLGSMKHSKRYLDENSTLDS